MVHQEFLADQAMSYGRDGWAVLPIKPREKRPLTLHGVNDASPDPNVIGNWWERWPDANIGLAVPVGYVVVDIDSLAALDQLKSDGLNNPTTCYARTARGWHLWYSCGSRVVRSHVGFRLGIDLRAPGCYVVAPPSVHPSGRIYQWKTAFSREAIAAAPDWIFDTLAPSPVRTRTQWAPELPSGGIKDWAKIFAEPVCEGRRNQALAEVAGFLFRKLPAEPAAEFALCWAATKLQPPLPRAEVERTIESIARLECQRLRRGRAQ